MAKEPEKKDGKRERAAAMYDSDSSVKHRERRGEERSETVGESGKKETPAGDKTEGGEPRRKPGEAKPGEAKPRAAGNPMHGGHRAEHEALRMKHEKERLDHHAMMREDHREMDARHMAELHKLRSAMEHPEHKEAA